MVDLHQGEQYKYSGECRPGSLHFLYSNIFTLTAPAIAVRENVAQEGSQWTEVAIAKLQNQHLLARHGGTILRVAMAICSWILNILVNGLFHGEAFTALWLPGSQDYHSRCPQHPGIWDLGCRQPEAKHS